MEKKHLILVGLCLLAILLFLTACDKPDQHEIVKYDENGITEEWLTIYACDPETRDCLGCFNEEDYIEMCTDENME